MKKRKRDFEFIELSLYCYTAEIAISSTVAVKCLFVRFSRGKYTARMKEKSKSLYGDTARILFSALIAEN